MMWGMPEQNPEHIFPLRNASIFCAVFCVVGVLGFGSHAPARTRQLLALSQLKAVRLLPRRMELVYESGRQARRNMRCGGALHEWSPLLFYNNKILLH